MHPSFNIILSYILIGPHDRRIWTDLSAIKKAWQLIDDRSSIIGNWLKHGTMEALRNNQSLMTRNQNYTRKTVLSRGRFPGYDDEGFYDNSVSMADIISTGFILARNKQVIAYCIFPHHSFVEKNSLHSISKPAAYHLALQPEYPRCSSQLVLSSCYWCQQHSTRQMGWYLQSTEKYFYIWFRWCIFWQA